MAFCSACGAQIPEGSTVCPACASKAAGGAVPAAPAAGAMADNVAGMLAYVTIIPAIIFLVMEPYNRNRFVRFHSFQSIFFGVAWIALSVFIHRRNDPRFRLAHASDLAAGRSRRTHHLDSPLAQSQPGPKVETAHHRRHG